MKGRDSIVRSTGIISAATVASRVLGLVRDSMIASAFGKALTVPFFTAFIIPNTLRKLFAEGALSAAFIPVFTECLHREGQERAARLGASVFKVLFLTLLIVSVLGSLFAPQIVQVLPHDGTGPADKDLTADLLRIMFPYILLIGLCAATMGMLNTLGRFFAPAFSPALLNIAMIAAILLGGLCVTDHSRIEILAAGVLAGGALQLLIQIVPLQRLMPLHLLRSAFWDPLMKRVLWLMAPLIFGQAITEVNILVSTYFAWTIPGAVSYLFYANRIVQFPLGVFAIAIATAAFPRLSRDAISREDSRKAVADTAIYALGKILFIMLPSAAGIAILGRDIFGAILNRGAFLREGSLEPTYLCALAYCAGLPFFASVKIIVSAFYARQNTRTPTLVGLLTVLCNLTLVILLRKPLGAAGLALATTLSSCLSFFVLTHILRGRLQVRLFLPIGGYFFRSALSALIMSAGLWAAGLLLPAPESRFLLYLLRLGILLPLGMGLYGLASWWIQRDEARVIWKALSQRILKR